MISVEIRLRQPLRSCRDLRFGAEPVFHVMAIFPATLLVQFMGAAADLFFEVCVRFSSYVCGWLLGDDLSAWGTPF